MDSKVSCLRMIFAAFLVENKSTWPGFPWQGYTLRYGDGCIGISKISLRAQGEIDTSPFSAIL
jgi:hypothetical protein